MDKFKVTIPAQDGNWGSYISKYPGDSGKVPLNAFTKDTRNVVTSVDGTADKITGGVIWNPNSSLSGAPLDQFEGIFADGTRLFIVNDAGTIKASTGDGVFTTITSGYTNPANFEFVNYHGRVYGCNGVDAPIVIDTATSYGGVTYSFSVAKTRAMGATPPASAATATRVTDSTTNRVPAGSHTYKITYVYYNGESESNGSSASAVCVNDGTHTSNSLTSIPIGGYGVTARNIYRDNNDGNWLLLDTISNNTATTYTDILPIGSTPTPLQTVNGLPPTFKYCALYLDRIFVIDITGRNIYWSTPGAPDEWNPSNVMSGPADDNMTAIYLFNNIPWIFGQHTAGYILGTTDSSFYYSNISRKTGCVDNRSIQTREIVSVPTMYWLASTPNKGIYYTNGSVIQYASDAIEDLTFNLAQIDYLTRQNTQDSQTAFQGGTASSGIDLTSSPGTIQTINPTITHSHAADWAAGTLSNIAVTGDQLQVPTAFTPSLGSGSLGGSAINTGSAISLPSTSDFTGFSNAFTGRYVHWGNNANDGGVRAVAHQFTVPRDGTLTSVTATWNSGSGSINVGMQLYSDSGNVPASLIATSGTTYTGGSLGGSAFSFGQALTGGSRYWAVVYVTNASFGNIISDTQIGNSNSYCFTNGSVIQRSVIGSPYSWGAYADFASISFAFTSSAISSTGTWTSPVYDSLCTTQTSGMTLTATGSYPGSTSSSILVQGSTTGTGSWNTTDTVSNISGTVSLTGGTYRYWRLVETVSTSDNRNVPTVGAPTMKFNTTGTWTSAPILCTTDITALSSLVQSVSTPGTTTSTITIATSASSGSGYSSFVALGSATPNTYAKIRVVLTADAADTTTPVLFSTRLDWAISSNLVSSIVNTGTSPAGWGVFQYSREGSLGTAAFYFKSATTSGGIPGASFAAVSNGTFPTAVPHQYAQWKVVLTATADNIPQIDSVTVNWYLSTGTNVRASSLFFNKSYYLSVATLGNTTNNLLIEYDYQGNWRIHDKAVGTMGLYFNDAFYGSPTAGNIYNAFRLPTENGTNITFDARFKYLDADTTNLKVVRSLSVTGVNTGTTITAYYSVDRGTTWYAMLTSGGNSSYATASDGSQFVEYFIPNFAAGDPLSGTVVVFRLVSSDAYPCSILRVKPTLYIRKGKSIQEAQA